MSKGEIEILLVEDNQDDIELTMVALRKNGLANTIQVLRDGEEALDYLFCRNQFAERNPGQQPRVILLDLKLPKVDGLEVLREIKCRPETKAIPVVVMTSSKEQRDLVDGYQLGVNSYIQKPVDFNQFREIIRQLGFYWLVINQAPPAAAFQRTKA